VSLEEENLLWVITPQRGYAETTLYQLEVHTVSGLYKVVVDIIDYNPLTDVERVSYCDVKSVVLWQGSMGHCFSLKFVKNFYRKFFLSKNAKFGIEFPSRGRSGPKLKLVI